MTNFTIELSELNPYVTGFAKQFDTNLVNIKEDKNYIASSFGAWLLVALISGANPTRYDEQETITLEEILGTNLTDSYRLATNYLGTANDEVAVAVGVWVEKNKELNILDWVKKYQSNSQIEYADNIPKQDEINAWVVEKSLNILPNFPGQITSDIIFIMATIIATKFGWRNKFRPVENTRLDYWNVNRVLLADRTHFQQLVQTTFGMFGVHVAKSSENNVAVVSVVAEEGVTEAELLAETHRFATEYANTLDVQGVTDLDEINDKGEFWSIETIIEKGAEIPDVRYITHLPAWEAKSSHDLNKPEYGLTNAINPLSDDLFADPNMTDFCQDAVAKYNTNGFEAAAITYFMAGRAAAFMSQTKEVKHVNIDFNKPYAVVAINLDGYKVNNGIPLFSAFVREAVEAEDIIEVKPNYNSWR